MYRTRQSSSHRNSKSLMKRLGALLVAAALVFLVACDTDPATDVGYHTATLQADARCQDGTFTFQVQHQLRVQGSGDTWQPYGPQYTISCNNEAGVTKNVPATAVSGLTDDTTYEDRLWAGTSTYTDGYYDSAGTKNGTVYDSFTTLRLPDVEITDAIAFGYYGGAVNAKVTCHTGTYSGVAKVQYRKQGNTTWIDGDTRSYTCANEPDAVKTWTNIGIPNLSQNVTYEARFNDPSAVNLAIIKTFTTQAFPTFTANPVKQFRDSVGVNTKLAFTDTTASNRVQTKAALQFMGVRRIRDGINWFSNGNGGYDNQVLAYNELNAVGIKTNLGFGCITDIDRISPMLDAFSQTPAINSVISWENPNEVNYSHSACSTADYANKTRAFAQEWHDQLRIRSLNQTILGPSCGGSDCEQYLGDLSAWVDAGNFHPYRGTGIPETAVGDKCNQSRLYVPDGPCYITEFGWALADWAGGDERIQAAYTLRGFLDYESKGVPVSFVHQLVDVFPNQETSHEGSFGLYRNDWSPRLVATALHNLTTGLGDGATGNQTYAFRWDTTASGLRWQNFRNSAGKIVMAVWRQTTAPGASATVTATIPDAQSVGIIRPLDSATPTPLTLTNHQVSFNVGPEPALLVITQ